MMRISGRGLDGTAKAVSTDNNGKLITKNTLTRDSFANTALNSKDFVEIGPLSSEGYQFAQLVVKFSNKRLLRLSKKEDNGTYEIVGESTGDYTFQYAIKGSVYYLKLENVDTQGGYLSYAKENLMSTPIVKPSMLARDTFNSISLNDGSSIEIGPLSSEGYLFSQLNIKFSNKRRLRLSKKDDDSAYEIIGEATGNYIFQYPITGKSYYLKLENIDTQGGYLSYAKENLMNVPIAKETSKIQSKRISFPDVEANSFIRLPISAPIGKYYDLLYMTIHAKTTGTGTVSVNMTMNEPNLYSEVFKITGSDIQFNLSGFGGTNTGEITLPNKFYPDEVLELQKHIREMVFIAEAPMASNFSLANNSNATVIGAWVDIYFIERAV